MAKMGSHFTERKVSANNIQTIKSEAIKGYYCKIVFSKDMIEDTTNTSTVKADQPMPDTPTNRI
jgi:hypothetical protein